MGTDKGKLSAVRIRAAAVVLVTLLSPGCGNPSTPTPTPTSTITVRFTTTGVSPKSVNIPLGGRVLFVNQDTREHTVGSDPHPDHTDCPPINQVGLLQPGQQRETGNFVTAGTCGFHDHEIPTDATLQGTIIAK